MKRWPILNITSVLKRKNCSKMCRCTLKRFLSVTVAFTGGCALGQLYYYCFLKKILFPKHLGRVVSIVISGILGIGNAASVQVRCVSALTLPMYCGKPGRGVLKAVVLTYIVAGPISNMGSNAREVVRVFACSTQLSYNLSIENYALMLSPLRNAVLTVGKEVEDFKNTFRSIKEVLEAIQFEIEDAQEVEQCRNENDFIDDLFIHKHRSLSIDRKFYTDQSSTIDHVTFYRKKLQYRCENELSRAVAVCIEEFSKAYVKCRDSVPGHAEFVLCWPLRLTNMCDLISSLGRDALETCDSFDQVPAGLEEAYAALNNVKKEFVEETNLVHLQFKEKQRLGDIQDAKETANRVLNAFEEKAITMHYFITIMNVCVALLALRIFKAAVIYHDLYLTDIDYDNVYVTRYFKKLDMRRMGRKYVLLPLKKMERNKYVDVHSLAYKVSQRKLVSQVLKVMLEVVTATTFVMLDRLFYEALDVVRQHALMMPQQLPTRDLEIEVEGTGLLATWLRKLHQNLRSRDKRHISNDACVPSPRLMPCIFFLKIYGGYLWILVLWLLNPYTSRLRRMVCSYMYPKREKQRILHLYNDILKNRMKMDKTLRRKAVQAVRAHYLTGENLLSMRMKFPQALGWLSVLPAARMTCLICGEVEPRVKAQEAPQSAWYSCFASKCPFVYCPECWREAGARCLACDPSLAEFSDVDSLTDEEKPVY